MNEFEMLKPTLSTNTLSTKYLVDNVFVERLIFNL